MHGDLYFSNFDTRQFGLTNIVKKLLKEKNNNVDDKLLNFEKCIKNLGNIDDKANTIIDDHEAKRKIECDGKRSC